MIVVKSRYLLFNLFPIYKNVNKIEDLLNPYVPVFIYQQRILSILPVRISLANSYVLVAYNDSVQGLVKNIRKTYIGHTEFAVINKRRMFSRESNVQAYVGSQVSAA